jgi:hypothetical protein
VAFVPYLRLVASGTLSGTQSWSIGSSFLVTGVHTNSALFTWLGTIDGYMKTFFQTTQIQLSSWDGTTVYNRLACYEYQAVGGASSQAQLFSAGVTGTGATSGPRQLCTVFSIRSGIGGRNKRGRFYLPATCKTIYSTNGQIAGADVTSLANAWKTFVNAANLTHIGTDPVIYGIASRASGFTVVAQDVKVDTKIDTQRRRTDKILAAGSAIAVF